MPIELNVSLLNDEDVVQHHTRDIHVSITGEDGKVRSAPRRRRNSRPRDGLKFVDRAGTGSVVPLPCPRTALCGAS